MVTDPNVIEMLDVLQQCKQRFELQESIPLELRFGA